MESHRARDRRLDRIDRLAAWFIRLGGLSIVLSVIAIIVFIGAVAFPLVRGTKATGPVVHASPEASVPVVLLVDEYLQQAAVVQEDGQLCLYSLDSSNAGIDRTVFSPPVQSGAASASQRLFALGFADGSVRVFDWTWRVDYDSGRHVRASWAERHTAHLFDSAGVALVQVTEDESGRLRLFAASTTGELCVYSFDAEWEQATRAPVHPTMAPAQPASCLTLSPDGRTAVAGYTDGRALVVDCASPESPTVVQFSRMSEQALTAVAFLLGGQSLVAGDARGDVSRWLPIVEEGDRARTFRRIDDFESSGGSVLGIVPSPRDKSFATWDARGALSVHHATTSRTYLSLPPGPACALLTLSPKADAVVAALDSGGVATWSLSNPHPEATLGTLIGKVWYEGYSRPEWVWQSTGGSDEFEPKLSLIPLLFGTLKGTFYAMLFSVPVAILAALYVSQLARPRFRSVVKPAIELMAALPSVVVGFLAALWLAPLIERQLIAVVLLLLAVPLFAVMTAPLWQLLPQRLREWLPEGWELLVALPFIGLGAGLALWIAPGVESAWFGGDVRQWMFLEHGIRFDPRNNIVVGIALGVAVIPIIFTMSEDALSNVPPSLVSGALALGASRWQATWRIVLRAASPGIFAAVMLGFGRAVGETMIVLMATGNTPILDWSIFNGMRTMSAAIAVEIPEAPHGGTLYRVLFLTAFLLFLFTLAVNTVATVVSTRLRERYGRF